MSMRMCVRACARVCRSTASCSRRSKTLASFGTTCLCRTWRPSRRSTACRHAAPLAPPLSPPLAACIPELNVVCALQEIELEAARAHKHDAATELAQLRQERALSAAQLAQSAHECGNLEMRVRVQRSQLEEAGGAAAGKQREFVALRSQLEGSQAALQTAQRRDERQAERLAVLQARDGAE